jgi:hypothetical protein
MTYPNALVVTGALTCTRAQDRIRKRAVRAAQASSNSTTKDAQ